MVGFSRELHRGEVERYLRRRFGGVNRALLLPRGSGNETYVAESDGRKLFVKLGTEVGRAVAMADAGIGPPVLDVGRLEDGTVIVVQSWVEGRHPGRADYERRLEAVARTIGKMHRDAGVRGALPVVAAEGFAAAGLRAVGRVRARWEGVREQVVEVGGFVEEELDELEKRIGRLRGDGLGASHNDICRDNWLFTEDGRIFILDLDSMALDDPALDVGIIMWWYYAPEVWGRFIGYAGYEDDEGFRERMQARIALHCLSITLPREDSFDRFDAGGFSGALRDFRAALVGQGNPEMQGG